MVAFPRTGAGGGTISRITNKGNSPIGVGNVIRCPPAPTSV